MKNNDVYNEKALLLKVAAGDEQAFEQLVLRYSEKLFFHALSFVKTWPQAEELVQDIFLRIWQKRDKLAEVDNLDNYLFIISKNFLVSAIKKKRYTYEALDALQADASLNNNPAGQYENKELRALLEQAIQHLPEQKQAVFRMIHQEGLSQEQVSQQLGIATRTVRWNLVSAINGIRDFLHRNATGELFILLLLVTEQINKKMPGIVAASFFFSCLLFILLC